MMAWDAAAHNRIDKLEKRIGGQMTVEQQLLQALEKIGVAATNMKSASAERLAAIDLSALPYKDIESVDLDWKEMKGEILPVLKIRTIYRSPE
jgi:hypothetical protein